MKRNQKNERRNVAVSEAIFNRLQHICYERNWSVIRMVEEILLEAVIDLEKEITISEDRV